MLHDRSVGKANRSLARVQRPAHIYIVIVVRLPCLLLCLLLGSPSVTSAQFWDFVYRTLNGDTTLGPDHDTAFIASYRDDLTLSAVINHQGTTIDLSRNSGGELSYATNTPAQYGVGLDYKWLALEASFTIPGLSDLDPDRGTTKATGLGFGYTGRRWWFRNFLRYTEGFHATDPELVDPDWNEGDPYPYRGDIRNLTYMASLNYGFNARRFSYNAAIWQMELQKRSAGSFIAGATFWYSQIEWDDSLIPQYDVASYGAETISLNAGRSWTTSLTGGYAYTVTLWKRGFVNALAVPGVGFRRLRLELEQGNAETSWEVAGTLELRAGAGYIGDRWYAALTANSYQNAGPVGPDIRFAMDFLSIRLAAGWRIKNMKPIWPKVGL